MSGKEIESWLETFRSSRNWLSNRYSSDRILQALSEWAELFEAEARTKGVPAEEIRPLDHFRPSYLRLSQGPNHSERLRARARAAVDRISKRALLEQIRRVAGKESLDASRLEKWSHSRIASRFARWENAIRAAVPDVSQDEVFRFFRLRYLYLPEDKFQKQAIHLCAKNTLDYHKRLQLLASFGIDSSHPEFDQWVPLAQWQFRRKAHMLEQALKRFWGSDLGFPPTSDSINQRDYHRYLKVCAHDDYPDASEEMIYKLLLYFSGVTREQLESILARAPEGSPWSEYDLDQALARLIELGLVEEQGLESGTWYQPSRSIHTELILETWLQRLRGQIKIGTREALEYLPAGYQRHQTNVIARKDIPRATEKIMRERRRLVSDMGIDRADSRYNQLIGLSRREIESELNRFQNVVESFTSGTLEVLPYLEEQLNIFLEEDLKPADRDVFLLVVNLGNVSMNQLGKIFRRYNGGRKGFALKSSLKRLCSVELFAEDGTGLYSLHPSLTDLESTETWPDLGRAVGLL